LSTTELNGNRSIHRQGFGSAKPGWRFAKQGREHRGRTRRLGLASAGEDGGRDRDRTCDPYHVKVVLFR
jgi:hypothetical protein